MSICLVSFLFFMALLAAGSRFLEVRVMGAGMEFLSAVPVHSLPGDYNDKTRQTIFL